MVRFIVETALQKKKGTHSRGASYHYPIYHWPILRFAKDIDPQIFQCLDRGIFSLEYMSEADPSHNSALIASLLAPEGLVLYRSK